LTERSGGVDGFARVLYFLHGLQTGSTALLGELPYGCRAEGQKSVVVSGLAVPPAEPRSGSPPQWPWKSPGLAVVGVAHRLRRCSLHRRRSEHRAELRPGVVLREFRPHDERPGVHGIGRPTWNRAMGHRRHAWRHHVAQGHQPRSGIHIHRADECGLWRQDVFPGQSIVRVLFSRSATLEDGWNDTRDGDGKGVVVGRALAVSGRFLDFW